METGSLRLIGLYKKRFLFFVVERLIFVLRTLVGAIYLGVLALRELRYKRVHPRWFVAV